MPRPRTGRPASSSLFSLLKPYRALVAVLLGMTILANSLNLLIPQIISRAIDAYTRQQLVLTTVAAELLLVAGGIFIFSYLQAVAQTYASERVARDLRTRLVNRISAQDHAFVQQASPAKLLTNLTSDVDAVKIFVSMAVASIISSIFLIIGASVFLLSINWKLALAVLATLPIIGVTFSVVLRKVRKLFTKSQEAIDWLNKVINESILGSALIRLLNSQQHEYEKFLAANTQARDISLSILRLFASLIPVIMFCTNLATLMILTLGGRFVIQGSMSLGDFTAFNSYLAMLIFPVIIIGLYEQCDGAGRRVLSIASPASWTLRTKWKQATWSRIYAATSQCKNVSVRFGEKTVLKRRFL